MHFQNQVEKMTIVHIIDHYQPDLGYQEVHLARAQARAGHKVVVITSTAKPAMALECESPLPEENVEVRRLAFVRVGGRLWMRGIERHLAEIKPDWVIVHCLMTWSAIRAGIGRLTRRFDGILTIDDHTVLSYRRTDLIGSAAYRAFRLLVTPWLTRVCRDFVAVTPETRSLLLSDYGIPAELVRLVPLGADADLFRPDPVARAAVRQRLGWTTDSIVIVYAGKFLPEKCLLELIGAVEPLAAENPKLKLLFIGSGPAQYADELHLLAGTLPTGCVCFHPAVSNRELPELLAAADIGVWPGSESIVHLEAMACGLAIVIRDKDSLRDRVAGGAGLLTTGDPGDIRAKLVALLNDPGLLGTIQRKARERIETQLCWQRLARQFEPAWSIPSRRQTVTRDTQPQAWS